MSEATNEKNNGRKYWLARNVQLVSTGVMLAFVVGCWGDVESFMPIATWWAYVQGLVLALYGASNVASKFALPKAD